MKRVFSTILLLLVLSFSYPIFSQQRNVVINTSSVDRTIITTNPDVDIWTQLEQERIAAENADQAHIADKKGTQPIAVETIETQSTQQMASAEDIQKCEQVHIQIKKLADRYPGSHSFKKYRNIYTTLPRTQKNVLILQKIQSVVTLYLRSQGTAYPKIEKQLKNASSMEDEIAIFLSYYKE